MKNHRGLLLGQKKKKIGVFRVPLPKKNRVGRSAKLLIFARHDFSLKFRVVKEQMSECIVIYSKYTENTVERSAEEDRHGESLHDARYKS